MKKLFEGYYFKHQKGAETLCVIVGRSGTEQFIQIITSDGSWYVPYAKGNHFSKIGIILDIHTDKITLTGNIRYNGLSPIRYDIMGIFRFFPMECRHGVISMSHKLNGSVLFNGKTIDFSGGKGYIEKDSGKSFPSSYTWIQANDFREDFSIMAAIANIPFGIFKFRGCICVMHYKGKEYRLATYLGARILCCTKENIILQQGRIRLHIHVFSKNAYSLSAPRNGEMSRQIMEAVSSPASYTLYKGENRVFHLMSKHTSFEAE